MPRKIVFTNELTHEAAIMSAEYCPMCGAVKGACDEVDRIERKDSELVRKLAEIILNDKNILLVSLYYVVYPLATVQKAALDLRLSAGLVCETRKKVSNLYPSLSGLLGLKTKGAISQQKRTLCK